MDPKGCICGIRVNTVSVRSDLNQKAVYFGFIIIIIIIIIFIIIIFWFWIFCFGNTVITRRTAAVVEFVQHDHPSNLFFSTRKNGYSQSPTTLDPVGNENEILFWKISTNVKFKLLLSQAQYNRPLIRALGKYKKKW